VRSAPNPTGALGVHEALPGIKVMNMSGCPHNPANTAAALVHYLTFNDLPALDQYNRPLFAYGRIIHDQCERRAHYDAGRFVTDWGDEGHRKGWCLYKMGCKGPAATFNCPVVGWNDHTSWPVRAGHGCIACAAPRFWDTMSPFYDRVPNVPGFGVEVTAGEIGLGLVAATVAGVTAHGLIQLIKPAPKPGAPPPGPGDTDKPEEPVLTGKGKQNGAPGR
jgi:hydrogenase small subunit